ncbi:unnamed protein product [Ilex paraguariensis]|uniref:Uncharacterized protein n=1 Tax=Ilex paraguariensis TaxID=185542 RepID=A0ABC8T5E7_9AQUA
MLRIASRYDQAFELSLVVTLPPTIFSQFLHGNQFHFLCMLTRDGMLRIASRYDQAFELSLVVLICRLIDRPLRPTMLKGFYHETQILSWVLSYDGLHAPDSLAITAAGIAVALSEVPNSKAIAGIRVGLIGDKFIVNPTTKEMEDSKLDLLLAGTDDAILMIEVNSCSFCFHRKLLAWANRHIFSTMGKVGLINLLELRILHGTRILYEMNMRTWQVSKM